MFSGKYKKNIGFTLEFADKRETKVRVYPIVEYADKETGFKFVDVEGKPLGVYETEKWTKKQIENFFHASGIENAVEIIEAHYKMHSENVRECEEILKEKEENVAFWENICKEPNDAERLEDRLNQAVRERTEEPDEINEVLLGYGIEMADDSDIVEIYEVYTDGEHLETAKKADVPVFSFRYGAYTEKELMEMSGGKLKEYFDFEREWESMKKQRDFFARKLADEREKMRLWSLMKR